MSTKRCVGLALAYWACAFHSVAQSPLAPTSGSTTLFYLPYSTQVYPQLESSVEQALVESGLGSIAIESGDQWQLYLDAIRSGTPGIYWAAPHFSAWLVHNHEFIPMFKLKTPLEFSIIVRKDNFAIFALTDLSQRTVCTQHTANLDFIVASRLFEQRNIQPARAVTWRIAQNLADNDQRCDAFVVSNVLLERVLTDHPEHWIKLYTGATFVNYSLLAHPDTPQAIIEQLSSAMTAPGFVSTLGPLWQDFSHDGQLEPAKPADYSASLLEFLQPMWRHEASPTH